MDMWISLWITLGFDQMVNPSGTLLAIRVRAPRAPSQSDKRGSASDGVPPIPLLAVGAYNPSVDMGIVYVL